MLNNNRRRGWEDQGCWLLCKCSLAWNESLTWKETYATERIFWETKKLRLKQVPITNEIFTKVETTQHDLDVWVPSMGDNPAMLALHKHNIRIRGYLLRQTGKRYKFERYTEIFFIQVIDCLSYQYLSS